MNAMETLMYFNIVATSVFTWYTFETNGNQKIVTNLSVGIAFTQLVVVVLYHAYKYSNQKLFQKLHGVICRPLNENDQPAVQDVAVPSVNSQPTHSVVELPQIINLECVKPDNKRNGGVLVDEKQSAMEGNNQCSNHGLGVDNAEQNDSADPGGDRTISHEHTSLVNVKSSSHANSCQTDSSTSVQLTEREVEMSQLHKFHGSN